MTKPGPPAVITNTNPNSDVNVYSTLMMNTKPTVCSAVTSSPLSRLNFAATASFSSGMPSTAV